MVKMILLAAALAALAFGQTVEEKETIQRTFPSVKRVEVENVFGSIRVAGYDGAAVELVAYETIRGESPEKVKQARLEVKLDISRDGDTLGIYVDGPFRCHCDDRSSVNFRGWRPYGYKVRFDFELKAPRGTSLFLRNVNDGEVKVEDIAGDYDIKNINGGIEMLEASGSGRAYALNGKLKVTFQKNPQAASYFGSLNGTVDLLFQPDLSADLRVKTFNGGIYSDFPVTYLTSVNSPPERRGGKFIYKSDRFTGIRVGKGGPEIKLDGFNGNINILNRAEHK